MNFLLLSFELVIISFVQIRVMTGGVAHRRSLIDEGSLIVEYHVGYL